MNIFKSFFNKKEEKPILSYQDFWDWFLINEKQFYKIVNKNDSNYISKNFFDKIAPKLNQLKEGIWYLTGMLDDNTADLILTANGNIQIFYIIEELIATAPKIKGWKFRAHKPEHNIENIGINMAGYSFTSKNIFFYSNDLQDYPDEIDITIVHEDYNEENKSDIINGCYLFIDHYLGELNSLTLIDNIDFKNKSDADKELIPIEKLKPFIIWREKEFVEKYEGARRETESDSYASLEATLQSGNKLIAVINTDLLEWDAKASHPWVLRFEIKYNGENNNGFPDEETYQLLNKIEDEINSELKDFEGYLNIGRETANGLREVYITCKEFRKPCKIADKIITKYSGKIEIGYEIFKDKYWRFFDKFRS
ncbi:DUF695 domain-containing protein [Polaribacter porphyrae]|uniref:DUF695 domain-containing protein n=1 Tax=Polaribacter porphyrae TaxID=1137780 RepID=A0A2S7WR28_9FLAO|nr:DUF695 domain-containing protein [Polaribacter porphyrae]PQJ80060.1 DUF695 domain-containing protein [Polaribacter porphyrae]